MSAQCQAHGCYRAVLEDHYACTLHWRRVRKFTRDRLLYSYDAAEYLDAEQQAQREMAEPAPVLLRGVG